MSLTKGVTGTAQDRAALFPIARVSRVPLRVGLEYGMAIKGAPMDAPNVAPPIRSSLAQQTVIHRFQLSRYISRLRTYGFAPGNPILKADSIDLKSRQTANTPKPVMTRLGQRPVPGRTPVFPRTAAPGTMGSPRRFPKALPVQKNTYTPPIYGTE